MARNTNEQRILAALRNRPGLDDEMRLRSFLPGSATPAHSIKRAGMRWRLRSIEAST